MKKKKAAALLLGMALSLSILPSTAYAARGDLGGTESGGKDSFDAAGGREDTGAEENGRPGGDGTHGGGKGDSEIVFSGTELTIPEGIADGNYTGKATVKPDEEEEFDAYEIEITVTMKDGSPISFRVSGADGKNANYSGKAQTGIASSIDGLSAGTYAVDAVSGATCSSTAIVQGLNAALKEGETLSGTYYEIEHTISYNSSGSSCLLTVYNPEKNTDYNISLAYGVGKFSDELTPRADYCDVEKVTETKDTIVYKITMKPDVYYEISDDDLTHRLYVNNPGTSLTVKVNDSSVGDFLIQSEAIPYISENKLSLTGGNGDTLSGYLGLISEVTVSYTDENGETVSETYSTSWQHDMEAAFLGSDLFDEDGNINFDLKATVTLTGEDFEALKDEIGNNITEEKNVFPKSADGDYRITISAGNGYQVLTADVGKSYAAKTENPDSVNEPKDDPAPAETNTPTDGTKTDEADGAETSDKKESDEKEKIPVQNSTSGNGNAASVRTEKESGDAEKVSSAPKTDDISANSYAALAMCAASVGILLASEKRLRNR